MFCHKCGRQALDDSVFCEKCGAKIIFDDDVQDEQVVASTPQQPQPAPPPPKPEPEPEPESMPQPQTPPVQQNALNVKMYCHRCGSYVEAGASACPKCGTLRLDIETGNDSSNRIYCIRCGTNVTFAEKYCPKCGVITEAYSHKTPLEKGKPTVVSRPVGIEPYAPGKSLMMIGGILLIVISGISIAMNLFELGSFVIFEYSILGVVSIPAGICAVTFRKRPSKAKVCIGLLLACVLTKLFITVIVGTVEDIYMDTQYIVGSIVMLCVCILCYVGAFHNIKGTDGSGCPRCKSSMCVTLSVKKVVKISESDSSPGCLDVIIYGLVIYLLEPVFSWFWRLLTGTKADEVVVTYVTKCRCTNCGKVYKYASRS